MVVEKLVFEVNQKKQNAVAAERKQCPNEGQCFIYQKT